MDIEKQKEIATRYIHAFNNDDWDTVREVVAPNFTFHHPMGGTIQAGPEGMVCVWADFKSSLPDSWHPIPIMIVEGDFLAVLLPTYGHFTGKPYHGVPPTGKWIEYGMVNIVRFENGKIAENWFGMDPLVEQQQMGAIPSFPSRRLNPIEQENLELFQKTINKPEEFDNLTAFGNVVTLLQKTHKFYKRLHLSPGRAGLREITHKTNPYAFYVCPVTRRAADMGTGYLVHPAKCYLYLAVTTVTAVAYDKIITHTLPMIVVPVHFIEYCGIPAGLG